MSPRTGRPKSDNPRTTQLGVRLYDEELRKLDYLSEYFNTSKAEAIRKSVEKVYSDLQQKK